MQAVGGQVKQNISVFRLFPRCPCAVQRHRLSPESQPAFVGQATESKGKLGVRMSEAPVALAAGIPGDLVSFCVTVSVWCFYFCQAEAHFLGDDLLRGSPLTRGRAYREDRRYKVVTGRLLTSRGCVLTCY